MIGIICAMQIEADGIIALCSGVKTENHFNMTFNFGRLCDKDVVVVVCGVGKVNAAMCATVMIERFSPDVIVNSGVAGAVFSACKGRRHCRCHQVGGTRYEHLRPRRPTGRGVFPGRRGYVF